MTLVGADTTVLGQVVGSAAVRATGARTAMGCGAVGSSIYIGGADYSATLRTWCMPGRVPPDSSRRQWRSSGARWGARWGAWWGRARPHRRPAAPAKGRSRPDNPNPPLRPTPRTRASARRQPPAPARGYRWTWAPWPSTSRPDGWSASPPAGTGSPPAGFSTAVCWTRRWVRRRSSGARPPRCRRTPRSGDRTGGIGRAVVVEGAETWVDLPDGTLWFVTSYGARLAIAACPPASVVVVSA